MRPCFISSENPVRKKNLELHMTYVEKKLRASRLKTQTSQFSVMCVRKSLGSDKMRDSVLVLSPAAPPACFPADCWYPRGHLPLQRPRPKIFKTKSPSFFPHLGSSLCPLTSSLNTLETFLMLSPSYTSKQITFFCQRFWNFCPLFSQHSHCPGSAFFCLWPRLL